MVRLLLFLGVHFAFFHPLLRGLDVFFRFVFVGFRGLCFWGSMRAGRGKMFEFRGGWLKEGRVGLWRLQWSHFRPRPPPTPLTKNGLYLFDFYNIKPSSVSRAHCILCDLCQYFCFQYYF